MKKIYILLISCVMLLFAGCAKEIDLTPYVEVDFDGYEGYGTATYEIDYEELITDYEDIFGYDDDDLEKKSGQRFLEDVMDAIDGELSDDKKLKNGDEVTFSWDLDVEDLEEEYKVKFSASDVTVKVKRLDELEEVDAFEGLEFYFYGQDGDGWLEVDTYNQEYEGFEYYFADDTYGLSNGDEIVLKLEEGYEEYCFEEGIIPEETEKKLVVEGLWSDETTADTGAVEQPAVTHVPVASPTEIPVEIYDIVIGNSGSDNPLLEEQIDRFEAEHPGIVINATIEDIGMMDVMYYATDYPEYLPDLIYYSQDQVALFAQTGVLEPLDRDVESAVRVSNTVTSVESMAVDGKLYGYPLTTNNGYFMFYDKSVIPEEHVDSLEDILADCEAAGKKFYMDLEGNAWYNISFMFATGCVSEWKTDEDGDFVSVLDSFNSEAGLAGLKGMQKVLKSSAYVGDVWNTDYSDAAVIIGGTWLSYTLPDVFGSNYGAADLPSFMVDEMYYHMSSFSGSMAIGVNSLRDERTKEVLGMLASYLTNAECQEENARYMEWVPTNLEAANSSTVQANPAWVALIEQDAYAVAQGNIYPDWWTYATEYATAAKEATTDEELWDALWQYENSVNGVFNIDAEEWAEYTIIGTLEDTDWGTHFWMEYAGDNCWVSEQPFWTSEGEEIAFCRDYMPFTDVLGINESGYFRIVLEINGDNWDAWLEDAEY